MSSYKELLKKINTFIFDYDGVLTDGTVLALESGEQLRTGFVKDGYALHHALKRSYRIAIISGGTSDAIISRCKLLGIEDIFIGVTDKLEVFERYVKREKLDLSNILYMGDDIPDYPVMLKAGLPACPQDAVVEIREISKYISGFPGGRGCVRDVIEQVLKVRGDWMTEDAFQW